MPLTRMVSIVFHSTFCYIEIFQYITPFQWGIMIWSETNYLRFLKTIPSKGKINISWMYDTLNAEYDFFICMTFVYFSVVDVMKFFWYFCYLGAEIKHLLRFIYQSKHGQVHIHAYVPLMQCTVPTCDYILGSIDFMWLEWIKWHRVFWSISQSDDDVSYLESFLSPFLSSYKNT